MSPFEDESGTRGFGESLFATPSARSPYKNPICVFNISRFLKSRYSVKSHRGIAEISNFQNFRNTTSCTRSPYKNPTLCIQHFTLQSRFNPDIPSDHTGTSLKHFVFRIFVTVSNLPVARL